MVFGKKLQLDDIRIASPCTASWEEMHGDERVRFCGVCARKVYNIQAMTRLEATLLLNATGRKPCVRLFLRQDGTVMTADCPVGLARLRKLVVKRIAATVAVLMGLCTGVAGFVADRVLDAQIREPVPRPPIPVDARDPRVPPLRAVMGQPMQQDLPKRITSAMTPPVLVRKVEPRNFIGSGRFGITILEGVVRESGSVTDLKVLRSSYRYDDAAAIAAVSQWKFTPALLNGRPVSVYVTFTVRNH